MIKTKVMGVDGKAGKEISLPKQFMELFRPDLIKKAVIVQQSHNIQPYGVDPLAGKKQAAFLYKRRRHYKTTYGAGRSRSPRKVMTRRGLHFYFVGAFAPNTVGGRTAHPPKAEKDWNLDINIKERRKAVRSAIAATMNKDIVKKRGHKAESLVIDAKLESFAKSKEVRDLFNKIGFGNEIERLSVKKVRAGRGKSRGRHLRTKIGPLFVVSTNCPLVKAARNFTGVDVVNVKELSVELLAPGTDAGRLTVWSDKAIEIMEKEKLFY